MLQLKLEFSEIEYYKKFFTCNVNKKSVYYENKYIFE